MDDRVRMNTLALATVTLSQSPCFWHAGTDLLRSKSLDRNSYDSGDWFNRIDWTATQSTFGSGLPPRWDNDARWKYLRPLLGDPALKPQPHHIRAARDRAHELLRIRRSSPLFGAGRTSTFEPGAPGVIVMVPRPRDRRRLQRDAASRRRRRRTRARRGCIRRSPSATAFYARRRVHGPGADRRSVPSVSSTRDRVDDLERQDPLGLLIEEADERPASRRGAGRAARRTASARPRTASRVAMSHGPSGESPSTYQVLNGRGLGLLVRVAGEHEQPLPVDLPDLRDLELAEAGRLGQRRREPPVHHVVAARVGEHAVAQALGAPGRGR